MLEDVVLEEEEEEAEQQDAEPGDTSGSEDSDWEDIGSSDTYSENSSEPNLSQINPNPNEVDVHIYQVKDLLNEEIPSSELPRVTYATTYTENFCLAQDETRLMYSRDGRAFRQTDREKQPELIH